MTFIETSKMSSRVCYGLLPAGSLYCYRQTRPTAIKKEEEPVSAAVLVQSSTNQDNISLLDDLAKYHINVISALNKQLADSGYDEKQTTIHEWNVPKILDTLYSKLSSSKVHEILIRIQKDPDTSDWSQINPDTPDWWVGYGEKL